MLRTLCVMIHNHDNIRDTVDIQFSSNVESWHVCVTVNNICQYYLMRDHAKQCIDNLETPDHADILDHADVLNKIDKL